MRSACSTLGLLVVVLAALLGPAGAALAAVPAAAAPVPVVAAAVTYPSASPSEVAPTPGATGDLIRARVRAEDGTDVSPGPTEPEGVLVE